MTETHASAEPQALAAQLLGGSRAALAVALNLLDDQRPSARQQASDLLAQLQQAQALQRGRLIGITGPPGAGKSSLTAALIRVWRQRGLRVSVLAVDPSSPISGGALLGDRLRMHTSSNDDGVFVRSLACRGEYGGLSAEVWPMSQVMLAAYDITLIETVGVGQREVDVARMCDTTCYIAQPGSGDSIQFIKAGILEVPDILVVNKEDMGAVAQRTLSELCAAIPKVSGDQWQVPVVSASAAQGTGVCQLADLIDQHHNFLQQHGGVLPKRQRYQGEWISKRLREEFGSHGLNQLGGEAAVIAAVATSEHSLLQQYQGFRQRLFQN